MQKPSYKQSAKKFFPLKDLKGPIWSVKRELKVRVQYYYYVRLHHIKKRIAFVDYPKKGIQRRVFGIGFHKTGTKSLDYFFKKLGLKAIHQSIYEKTGIDFEHMASWANGDPDKVLTILDPLFYEYHAFSDVPFPGLYRQLSGMFPNSRFILTYRDPEKWWGSLVRHWHLEEADRRLHTFEAIQYELYEPHGKLIFSIHDKDILIDKYLRHRENVEKYFEGTGRLLVAEVEDEDLAGKIARFLDLEGIELAFPHIGKSKKKSYR